MVKTVTIVQWGPQPVPRHCSLTILSRISSKEGKITLHILILQLIQLIFSEKNKKIYQEKSKLKRLKAAAAFF